MSLADSNGDGEIRTLDPLLARQVLSQLSYTPIKPEIREANFVLEFRFKKRAMLQRMFFRSESSHKKSEAFLRSFSHRANRIEDSILRGELSAISRNQLDYGSLFNFEWTQEDVRSLSSNIYSRRSLISACLQNNPAATYSPVPSPAKYHRPLKS